MQYRNLGRTGLKVSPLCLGTMNFGPRTEEDDAHAIMDRALEHGINFFDTANVYGWVKGEGVTEQIVGRWLAAQGGGRRESIVLATKVYGPMGDWPNERGLSAYHIRRACEDSLRRLQTDHIDLYQMHHIERSTPWEEIWQAMDLLVRQGKILYVGSSNFAGWNLAQANAEADKRGLLGIVSEQCRYSLMDRLVELEVLPAARSLGIGIIPWGPLGGGLLAGKIRDRSEKSRREADQARGRKEKFGQSLERWEAFCRERGQEPADVALAWLLANPTATAPIIGPRTAEQVDASLRALEIHLNGEDLKAISDIWPGPGGEAPEAWAW